MENAQHRRLLCNVHAKLCKGPEHSFQGERGPLRVRQDGAGAGERKGDTVVIHCWCNDKGEVSGSPGAVVHVGCWQTTASWLWGCPPTQSRHT